MKKFSEIRRFRFYRTLALCVLGVYIVVVIAINPQDTFWTNVLTLLTLLIALICTMVPVIIHLHVIGSAEVLLDHSCDPAAFVQRCDKMGLLGPLPRRGLYRQEAVLLHRYGIALIEVGRTRDAAQIRRYIEEALTRGRRYYSDPSHSARRRANALAYCVAMDMCLADLCARLGDAEAAMAYEGQFKDELWHLPQSAFKSAANRDLELGGRVTISSSIALFLPVGASPAFSEGEVTVLESNTNRRRLAAEARMALAEEAWYRGESDRERSLLEQVAAAAPRMRVGRVAAFKLAFRSDTGTPVGYETLRLSEPVDPHPALPMTSGEYIQQNR
ncbi:MAG: hypothetical protein ACOYIK_08380 [Coriobacteriales bacterium]